MGVGGMIGGGIFSILGVAVAIAGRAAPVAFLVGSGVALAAGYSYIKLALALRNDGASFTYLEHAFPHAPVIARLAGWIVIVGYTGTLALYAFTFGAYGADLLGAPGSTTVRLVLSNSVLLFFMAVNLRGVRTSGRTEDLVVYTKIIIMALVAIAGFSSVRREFLTPFFDKGVSSVFVSGALVFVVFEGFQLITNAVQEIDNPARNVPRGIYGSIVVTSTLYLALSFVAVGSMPPEQLVAAKEYALAVAAQPALGDAGRVLVALAALLATSSAINATAFGASRMMAEMAQQRVMPAAFSFRSRHHHVPWLAVVTLTVLAAVFSMANSLDTIASFSSFTFMVVSFSVCVANLRLRRLTNARVGIILAGMALILIAVALLVLHMWREARATLVNIAALYLLVVVAELATTKRLSGAGGAADASTAAGSPQR